MRAPLTSLTSHALGHVSTSKSISLPLTSIPSPLSSFSPSVCSPLSFFPPSTFPSSPSLPRLSSLPSLPPLYRLALLCADDIKLHFSSFSTTILPSTGWDLRSSHLTNLHVLCAPPCMPCKNTISTAFSPLLSPNRNKPSRRVRPSRLLLVPPFMHACSMLNAARLASIFSFGLELFPSATVFALFKMALIPSHWSLYSPLLCPLSSSFSLAFAHLCTALTPWADASRFATPLHTCLIRWVWRG
mmetsp:Transcript_33890/g.86997  ORF Transcript_33890/g.86997 Transcript_33890/m.86997 type:complete len:244 (+) Transcript_33890:495-1226(+)